MPSPEILQFGLSSVYWGIPENQLQIWQLHGERLGWPKPPLQQRRTRGVYWGIPGHCRQVRLFKQWERRQV